MGASSLSLLTNAVLPAAVAAGLVFTLNHPAKKFGVSSETGGRRIERRPVPLVGGIAIFLASLLCLFFVPMNHNIAILFGLSLPVFLIGAFDDTVDLNAPVKLPIEIVCAAAWVLHFNSGDLLLSQLGLPALLAQILTVFWIVGITNAKNLSDGIDGLSGGLSLLIAVILIFACPTSVFVPLWTTIAFAIVGFLPFNFSRRFKTFLGDSGSLWLGFVLACTASASRFTFSPLGDLFIILSLFCYSEFDTLYSVLRRMRASAPIMTGDHFHTHHQIRQLGFSALASTCIILSVNLLVALSFIFSAVVNKYSSAFASTAVAIFLFVVVTRSSSASRQRLRKAGGLLIAQSLQSRRPNLFGSQDPQDSLVAILDTDRMFDAIPFLENRLLQEAAACVQKLSLEFEIRIEEKCLHFFSAKVEAAEAVAKISKDLAIGLQMRRQEDGSLGRFVTFFETPAETKPTTKAA